LGIAWQWELMDGKKETRGGIETNEKKKKKNGNGG